MKRDMNIIHRIILAVQAADDVIAKLDGVAPKDFAAHAQLLAEAGLVKAGLQGDGNEISKTAIIYRLTWLGHDFADAITAPDSRSVLAE